MKTIIILLIASFTTFAAFAQKSKGKTTITKPTVVTTQYICPMHSEVVSTHDGICAKCSSKLIVDRRGSKQTTNVFTCSMHPQVISNETGKCPICGQPLENQNAADGKKGKL